MRKMLRVGLEYRLGLSWAELRLGRSRLPSPPRRTARAFHSVGSVSFHAAAAVASLTLSLAACITGYTRESPMAVYPAGELSGPPTYFVGWKFKFGG